MIQQILYPIRLLFGKDISRKKTEKIINITDIYTPLSVAKEEVWKRWNDKELRKRVEEFLGGDVPNIFKEEPRSILARHITSPNFELLYFLDTIKLSKLKPLFVEYGQDLFSSQNKEKYHLCKLYFEGSISDKLIQHVKAVKVVDFNLWEGKKLKDIEIKNGKKLIEMHRFLLSDVDEALTENICDISNWIDASGKNPKLFYVKYLALFLCHGILFENFSVKDSEAEKKFVKEIVIPAIIEIENIFGIRPIIVPLLPIGNEEDLHWWRYPYKQRIFLANFLK